MLVELMWDLMSMMWDLMRQLRVEFVCFDVYDGLFMHVQMICNEYRRLSEALSSRDVLKKGSLVVFRGKI